MNFSHPLAVSTNLIITDSAPAKEIFAGGGNGFGNDKGNSNVTVGGIVVEPDIKKQ